MKDTQYLVPLFIVSAFSAGCSAASPGGGGTGDPEARNGDSATETGDSSPGESPVDDPNSTIDLSGEPPLAPTQPVGPWELPEGHTTARGATASGSWKVLGPSADADQYAQTPCIYEIRGIARDFQAGWQDTGGGVLSPIPGMNPDFGRVHNDNYGLENYERGEFGPLVGSEIGADRKPVYSYGAGSTPAAASPPGCSGDCVWPGIVTGSTYGSETFGQWYNDTEGMNQGFILELSLEPQMLADGTETSVFDSEDFFPIDGFGFGNEDENHNYHFTTEFHTSFTYQGGEIFTFKGDDDVWVFVDGKLALDLGGVHGVIEATIEMDNLRVIEPGKFAHPDWFDAFTAHPLTVGQSYQLDIFHAERQRSESNFRVETTLSFDDCGQISVVR